MSEEIDVDRIQIRLGHGWSADDLVSFARESIDLLPDSDPRKITREKIDRLRMAARAWDGVGQDPGALERWFNATDDTPEPEATYYGGGDTLLAFLDALASYLPPEEQT